MAPLGHRHVQALAQAVAAVLHERQRDRPVERRAVVGRGDVTQGRSAERRLGFGRHLRALLERRLHCCGPRGRRAACGPSAACRSARASAGRRNPSALRDQPVEAEIVRDYGAVRLLADDDVALLRAQHVHGLGAVGASRRPWRRSLASPPRRPRGAGRHVDLEAELAREADAEQARRDAADAAPRARPCAATLCRRGRRPRPAARSPRARVGPCTAMTAHCSVVEVSQTCRSGHSVCR